MFPFHASTCRMQRRRHMPPHGKGIGQELDRILPAVDLVSLDVFDTLVRRRVHPPDLVKARSAGDLSRILHRHAIAISPHELLQVRREVEARLARQRAETGNDPEYSFEPTVRMVVREIMGACDPDRAEEVAGQWISQELRCERAVLAVNPEMARLLSNLVRQQKRVVLCSDMYLSEEAIRGLLAECGLDVAQIALYVSGDVGLNKASGRLFRYLLEREGVAAARTVHIGDNYHSDYVSPRRVGLQAIRFKDRGEARRRNRITVLGRLAEKSDYWKGAHLFAMCGSLQGTLPATDIYYNLGRQVLGPAFCVFTDLLLQKVRDYRIDNLLFLAREGYLFKRLYDQFSAALAPSQRQPSTAYACLSRSVTFLAGAPRLTPREIELGLFGPGQRNLQAVLRVYSLPDEPFCRLHVSSRSIHPNRSTLGPINAGRGFSRTSDCKRP